MAIEEARIRQVMDILAAWGPLKASKVKGRNYRSETIEILHKLEDPETTPARIIRNTLNETLDLSLSVEDCTEVGRQIMAKVSDRPLC